MFHAAVARGRQSIVFGKKVEGKTQLFKTQ